MVLDQKQILSFQEKILIWYAENRRDLPWRHTRDPYNILVSEVMSQQTQISRVIPKYQAWINVFPTIFDLAQASTTEVLQVWSGLGYNRRALYLQKAAQKIVETFTGKFPEDEKTLRSLPGIGEYTARAVLCFAFGHQIAVVDTNVRKVILTEILKEARIMHQEPRSTKSKNLTSYFLLHDSSQNKSRFSPKQIEDIAQSLLPQGHAYEWNQALMDYAGAVLKNEKIPIPKQSKFKTSDRYYRGQIIKILLQKKQVSAGELIVYFNEKQDTIEQERLLRIIQGLVRDSLVAYVNSELSLN